ncbi:MAG: replicative DNA helicase [Betaproteobacteria bacterium]|nr:replicative DNA helicase [Betaproteobacteria bacterium]
MAQAAAQVISDPQLELIKLPPHSVESEQSVLGGLLLDNTAWDKIADLISEEDFYRQDHRLIYRHISKLADDNKPADVITVVEALERSGELQNVGGLAYVGSLAQNTPSAANIRRYAEIVRERSVMRKLAQVGGEIAESAFNPLGRNATELVDEAESKVFQIAEAGSRGRKNFEHINPLLKQVMERIDDLYTNPREVTGVPTGFSDLDRMTAGLQPGDLIVVGGRPSMGKTSFALNIGEFVALEEKKPVAVFSMEMGGTQLAMRLLASVGRLDQLKVRTGKLVDEDWGKITIALGRLNDAPIYIDESAGLNPLELRARARRMHRQAGGLGLIIVDYLQLMSGAGSKDRENRATELSEISRSLKALAKELGVPVMALSQLNRAIDARTEKRPLLSDLRESGAIEQDADVIMFIYRDEFYNEDSPKKGIAEIIVGKQRNGPVGKVELTFLKEYTRFENYADPGRY